MQRFVLIENISRFVRQLADSVDDLSRDRLKSLPAAAERELSLLEASEKGVGQPWDHPARHTLAAAQAITDFHTAHEDQPYLAALIDPAPGLEMVAVNKTYERASGLARADVIGKNLFELFPDNPEDPDANGVHNLYDSLRRAAETGMTQGMGLQRYDVQGPDGQWAPRFWRPVNSVIRDTDGHLIYLLHVVEEAI